jgi:2'-5' RNA ligase
MGALVNYPQAPFFQGSIVKEYLLVINPGDHVGQQVMEEKVNFFHRYGAKVAIKTTPHITVANFLAKEEMEDTLLRWMHRIISSHRIFPVALNNFSGFPNAHTIYLRVQDHQPFKQLAKELKVIDELVISNGLPKAYLISNPHMTIARRLGKLVYDKAMPEYSKKDFHAEFEVKELLLLKRTHQFDSGKQVNVFRLLP